LLLHIGWPACTRKIPFCELVVPIACYGAWIGLVLSANDNIDAIGQQRTQTLHGSAPHVSAEFAVALS
jgi:hypothetical protein